MCAPPAPDSFGTPPRLTGLCPTPPKGPLSLLLFLALALGACVDSSADPVGLEDSQLTVTSPEIGPTLNSTPPHTCVDDVVAGAKVRVCRPDGALWNGDLVVWAHGYVPRLNPASPLLTIPDDKVGDQPVQDIILGMGYGYATTSYRDNGLIADLAVFDLDEAAGFFESEFGPSNHRYLVGASEGGLAAALSLERNGPPYDGGMILCAPVGRFRDQIQYYGDFRVLLDVVFPNVVPGDPWGQAGNVAIDPALMTPSAWSAMEDALTAAAVAHPNRMAELLKIAGVPFDAHEPSTAVESALGVLWYNIFATNDIIAKVGGLPYGNRFVWYRGSSNDWRLNREVQRIDPTVSPGIALAPYETDGSLQVPAVGMHTTLDPIIPFSQGIWYRFETLVSGVGFGFNFIPVRSYGHCAFEAPQVLAGFALMVWKATGLQMAAPSSLFSDAGQEADFLATAREMGANPKILRSERRQ